MEYSLTLRKEAESDIGQAFEYYEHQRPGLGHDFLLCIEEGLAKIERSPLQYKKILKEVRRIAVRRFPYRIFYLTEEQAVIVVAVFHARRDPNAWENRT